MTADQIAAFAILGGVLVLFIWGRLRYDLVAFIALFAGVATAIVPAESAFAGFGHPAVITVVLVFMLSEGLYQSGAIDVIANRLVPDTKSPSVLIAALAGLGAVFSGLMNNVGALALLMPVALQASRKSGLSPALILMPLSFGTILGGLTTLIGTPPNIIVSSYRASNATGSFGLFDYSWVGVPVALAGVLFVTLLGWRLIPKERSASGGQEAVFDLQPYITEVRVNDGSKIAGKFMLEVIGILDAENVSIMGLIRGDLRLPSPGMTERIQAGDILVVSADADQLDKSVADLKLELVGEEVVPEGALSSDRIAMVEAVVSPRSRIERRSAADVDLFSRHGINLLAVSRQGRQTFTRLKRHRFQSGDVLLLQGDAGTIYESLANLGLLPLAKRDLRVGRTRRALFTTVLFAAAILVAAFRVLPITITFGLAVAGMILGRIMSPSRAYGAIEFPVVVLLGCMIPVGEALETTGAASLIADGIVTLTNAFPPAIALAVVMIVTMTLSDIMNNAATAVVMAPIAAQIASLLGANPDAFLMAVAIGASCAFLTPIGHQNNTIVLGPGGYRFGDYWRMGLPLEIIVFAVSMPLLMVFWPL